MSKLISRRRLNQLATEFINELDDDLMATAERLEIYLVSRGKGTSPKMARMFAFRQHPSPRTATNWWAGNGKHHVASMMGEKYANEVKALLARRGIRLGPHDDYDPMSTKFKGDPDAVIRSSDDPRSRLRRAQSILADWQRRKAEAPAVPLAENIIRDKIEEQVKETPELKRDRRELKKLRQRIIKKHGNSS